jgi:hypothetical protein
MRFTGATQLKALSMHKDTLSRSELLNALRVKAEDRGSAAFIESHAKHLGDIAASAEISKMWAGYAKGYSYARGIALRDILALLAWVFDHEKSDLS